MSALGGFASGLASGFVTGRELALKEAEARQAKEKWALEKPLLQLNAARARKMAQLYGLNIGAAGAAQPSQAPATTPTVTPAGQAPSAAPAPSARPGTPRAVATGGLNAANAATPGTSAAPKMTPKQSFDAEQHLRAMGDRAVQMNLPQEAIKFYAAANNVGKVYFDNQLDKAVKGALATGKPDALVDFYNNQINDGGSATTEKGKDGSYTVKFWKKDGTLAEQVQFKNLDGMISRAAEMGGYQAYALIKAGELKSRLLAMAAQAKVTTAQAAEQRAAAEDKRLGIEGQRLDVELAREHAVEARDSNRYLTDAAKWNADLHAGRVTKAQYDAHFAQLAEKNSRADRSYYLSLYRARYPHPSEVKNAPTPDQFVRAYRELEQAGGFPSNLPPDVAKPVTMQDYKALPAGTKYYDWKARLVRVKK